MSTPSLTHIDSDGRAFMVDVSEKQTTVRVARARSTIQLNKLAFEAAIEGSGVKGNVISTAEIAGVMAAKKTSELIPMCHAIPISNVHVRVVPDETNTKLLVFAEVKSIGQTGVEMEAMTAASVAALTLYDMLKAIDKSITILDVQLEEKKGGKSGDYVRPD